jgi:cobalamin biosynthesis Mg chelatase CobN
MTSETVKSSGTAANLASNTSVTTAAQTSSTQQTTEGQSSTTTKTAPGTGDGTPVLPMAVAFLVSVMMLVVGYRKRTE